MLERFSFHVLQDIPNIIFQLDSAPPHWSLDKRDCWDEHFPERVAFYEIRRIWRGGPIEEPARSLDLTLCNIFM